MNNDEIIEVLKAMNAGLKATNEGMDAIRRALELMNEGMKTMCIAGENMDKKIDRIDEAVDDLMVETFSEEQYKFHVEKR